VWGGQTITEYELSAAMRVTRKIEGEKFSETRRRTRLEGHGLKISGGVLYVPQWNR